MTVPNMRENMVSREFLRIGGGFGSAAAGLSPAGGLDVDSAGVLATDGDITTLGAVDVRGGTVKNTVGNLTLDAQNAAAHSTIYLKNSQAAYKAHVDVEGNAAVGGDLALGGVFKNWHYWMPAREMWTGGDSPCVGPMRTRWAWMSETQTMDYSDAYDQSALFNLALPDNYDGRALRVTLYWTAVSGTAGVVVWKMLCANLGDNDNLNLLYSGSGLATDTFLGVGRVHVCGFNITPDGAAAGRHLLTGTLRRSGDYVGDTFNGAAMLIGMKFTFA